MYQLVTMLAVFLSLIVATTTVVRADPRYPQPRQPAHQPTHQQPAYHPQPVQYAPQPQQRPGQQWQPRPAQNQWARDNGFHRGLRPGGNWDRRPEWREGWRNLGRHANWGELRGWHNGRVWWPWRSVWHNDAAYIYVAFTDWTDEVAWNYQQWGLQPVYIYDDDGNVIGVGMPQPW